MLQEAISALKGHQLICFPTETVYALACLASSASAVEKMYSLKQRAINKPFSIMLGNVNQIKNIAILNDQQNQKIVQYYLPGPFTFILPLATSMHYLNNTVGIRVPNHPLALALMNDFGSPIVATSVNLSGQPSVVRFCDIPAKIKENTAVIICDDALVSGTESTIIDLTSPKPKILRGKACLFKNLF